MVNPVLEAEGCPDGASASETPADTERPRSGSAAAHDEGVLEISLGTPAPRKIGRRDGGPTKVEAALQQLADEINAGHEIYELTTINGLKHARHVGERLMKAKSLCPRGRYQHWLRVYCPKLNLRTARHYMWVYSNPDLARERFGLKRRSVAARKRQSVAARMRPAPTATAAAPTSSEQAAEEQHSGATCPPPTVDDHPNDQVPGDLPEGDRTVGQVETEAVPGEKAIARTDRSRSPGNPAPARPDGSRQGANGETSLEPNGPGQADDGREGRDDPFLESTKAARFVRLCWDITDAAHDVIQELGAGADAPVLDRLRLLVPQAMKGLGDIALALQIEPPAASNSAEASPSEVADHLAGPGDEGRDQADPEASPPPDGIVASPSREEHHEHDQS